MSEGIRYFLFLLIIFLSNTVQVITGFAGALLAMPPSIQLLGAGPAKAIVAIVSGASSLFVAVRCRKQIDRKEFCKILVFMGIGLWAGMKLFQMFELDILLKIYGAVIILIALKKLLIRREFQLPAAVMYLCLLAAGLIHGMFVSGGAFLVVYAVWALPDKEKFRATVSAIWVVLNVFLLYDHYQAGYFTAQTRGLLLLAAVPFFLAVWLGNRLARRISAQKFLFLTYSLLLVSGAVAFL